MCLLINIEVLGTSTCFYDSIQDFDFSNFLLHPSWIFFNFKVSSSFKNIFPAVPTCDRCVDSTLTTWCASWCRRFSSRLWWRYTVWVEMKPRSCCLQSRQTITMTTGTYIVLTTYTLLSAQLTTGTYIVLTTYTLLFHAEVRNICPSSSYCICIAPIAEKRT